jgi:phage-related holin
MTRYTKSIREWIIVNITFVRNTITHMSASNRLSRQFIALMRRQMNITNTTKRMHVKIARMLIKTIVRSLKFHNTRG